jgi:hypothetical protein
LVTRPHIREVDGGMPRFHAHDVGWMAGCPDSTPMTSGGWRDAPRPCRARGLSPASEAASWRPFPLVPPLLVEPRPSGRGDSPCLCPSSRENLGGSRPSQPKSGPPLGPCCKRRVTSFVPLALPMPDSLSCPSSRLDRRPSWPRRLASAGLLSGLLASAGLAVAGDPPRPLERAVGPSGPGASASVAISPPPPPSVSVVALRPPPPPPHRHHRRHRLPGICLRTAATATLSRG